MTRKIIVWIVIVFLAIVALLGTWFVGMYNRMVSLSKEVAQQQAQVEVQLQRRYDLIPNLVESVKGVLTQEQQVFADIASARASYANAPAGSDAKIEASNNLESAISRLLVIVENYPELKSDKVVQSLMDELAGTENRIAVERRRYNEVVTEYNQLISVFPNKIVASMFGFTEKPLFVSVDGADTAPEVDLTVNSNE